MAASVLHFGTDLCCRLPVLNSVGYSVEVCPTLPEFRTAIKLRADADAVLVASEHISEHREVISLTRENTHAGLILFDPYSSNAHKREFDLVITSGMHPEEWLRAIAGVIEQSRGLNERSRAIREQSAQLIRDCKLVREEWIFQRERFAREQANAKRMVENIEDKFDPPE